MDWKEASSTERSIVSRNPASATVPFVTGFVDVKAARPRAGGAAVMIDPEVSVRIAAGRTRVLVQLRVDGADEGRRAEEIARVQDAVLSRLPQSHASLTRRYTSVALLALEIDATALRALETMSGEVSAIKPDHLKRPR